MNDGDYSDVNTKEATKEENFDDMLKTDGKILSPQAARYKGRPPFKRKQSSIENLFKEKRKFKSKLSQMKRNQSR